MSDILLSVGMQKGSVGSSQIEIDIKEIVNRISKNPPKVKVGLQIDQSAINHFKSQLSRIVNSVGRSKGSPITVRISGLGEITSKATDAKRALEGVTKSGKTAADSASKMGEKQNSALTRINSLLKAMRNNYQKWTAAQKGESSGSYAVYGQQIQALEQLKANVESGTISYKKFKKTLEAITASASNAASEISRLGEDKAAKKITILEANTEEYRKALKLVNDEIVALQRNQEKWTAAKSGKSAPDYQALSQYEKQLEELVSDLNTSKLSMDDFARRFNTVKSAADNSRASIRKCGEDTKSLGDRVKGLADKFGIWLGVSQVIMQVVHAIKQMVSSVREVDAAMTELKKVTNESNAAYSKFLSNASTRARQIGSSLSDVINASADFARLGYGLDDAAKLADAALIYKNIGDGITDISMASESIISTMQAFGIEASNVMSIVDKFNEVGNNFAISSAGIGDAMQRSAAAMAAANNTIDETIALITAANTIVQNPDSVGTTLKTVSMYLRAAKTEAEEAGESTDGMAGSVSELRSEILELTGQKVDIQLDDNTFKSTYQILKDLSQVWGDLSDVSQANLLELIGGKRNANVVSALLENFSIAEEAVKRSAGAAGSAIAENEKQLMSVAGRIEQFKASFETLSISFISSDMVKGIIDFGTGLLNILNIVIRLVNAIGGLKTVLTTTIGILAVVNANSITASISKIATMISSIAGIATKLKDLPLAFQLAGMNSSGFDRLSNALNAVGISASSAQLAIGSLAAGVGIAMVVIPAIAKAVDEAVLTVEEAKEKIVELESEMSQISSTIQDTATEFRSMQQSANDIIPRFAELAQGVDAFGNNVSLTDEEYREFLDLNNQISELFPELTRGYDANGNAILALSGDVDTLTESLYDCVEAQRQAAANEIAETMPDVLNNISETTEAYQKQIGAIDDRKKKLEEFYKYVKNGGTPDKILRQGSYYNSATESERLDYYEYLGVSTEKYTVEKKPQNPRGKPTQEVRFRYVFDEESLDTSYQNALLAMDRQQQTLREKIDAYQKKLNPVVNAWLQTDFMYNDLNDNMKSVAQMMVSGLDFSGLGLKTQEDVQTYIQDNILEPLFMASPEVEEAIGNITDWRNQLKNGEITMAEFSSNVTSAFESLFASMTPDQVKRFKSIFVSSLNEAGVAGEDFDAVLSEVISGWGNFSTVVGDLPEDSLHGIIDEFGVLKASIDAATKAQTDLEAALNGDDWDSGYEKRVEAFESFQDTVNAGEYGSKKYSAYKDYFIRDDLNLDASGVKKWMEENQKYFTEGSDGVLLFLKTVEQLGKQDEAFRKIAHFDSSTGEFWYDINQLDAFAEELGWTEEMLQDFIYKYRMYCEEWESRSPQENFTELVHAGIIFSDGDKTLASLTKLSEYTGLSREEVYKLVDAINELRRSEGLDPIEVVEPGQIEITQSLVDDLMSLYGSADLVEEKLHEMTRGLDEGDYKVEVGTTLNGKDVREIIQGEVDGDSPDVTVDIKMTVNDEEVIATVNTTAQELENALGKDWEIKLTGEISEDAEALFTLLDGLPSDTEIIITDSSDTVRTNLSNVAAYLAAIEQNSHQEIVIDYKVNGVPFQKNATGTKRAKRGPSLLGDEYSPDGSPKPELVVSGDRAYIAGMNGPEIGYLNEGDIVYTADETKRILRGNTLHKSFQAHAGGTAGDWIGLSGGRYSHSGKGPSSGGKSDDENWFERQYKDHNHWIEMDKENMADYLDWLDDAYKRAYDEGIIDIDEYYKYEEEVLKKTQDLFKDHLNDIDHEISLLEDNAGSSDEIINLTLQAIVDIEKELAAARAAGLDENGDYIQYLEQQWAEYSQTVIDMREDAESEIKSSIDDLVEYRIDMLKQEIEDEKDALNKKLDDLQEFYDKQREMLQDKYDEEKYLEEQNEKRKSVSEIRADLAMLDLDNSAWAQKRKLELQEELAEAEKELESFEKDHALDMTLDMLDKQQEDQEAEIQAQIDALDEKLNDPHALFNQALEDIKNNTAELYQEFIQYNRKHGSGNDQDIADMWEEAYKADLEYQDTHNGEHLDGIAIGNYTGYVVPDAVDPPQPDPEQQQPNTEQDAANEPAKTYPYGRASDTNGDIGVGSNGEKVKAIQYALNELGFGNAGTKECHGMFGPDTKRAVQAFQRAMGISADGIVGNNTRAKFKAQGYALGTKSATYGIHEVEELGTEYIFESPSDGSRYRMFHGGEKVLNADATNFLYDFATSGGGILMKMLSDLFGLSNFGNISKPVQAIEIHSGDIIVHGNANERTVSEIRRAQRENLEFVIREFNQLNK